MMQTAPETAHGLSFGCPIPARDPAFKIVNSGKTRTVILLGPYAIKIAKFGIGHMLRRSCAITRAGEFRQKSAAWKHQHGWTAAGLVLRVVFLGIWANWTEYRLWRDYPEKDLAPTLFTLFYLVNVQRRGTPVEHVPLFDIPWLRLIPQGTNLGHDMLQAVQYCALGGRICLADYGHYELESILAQGRRFVASVG